MVKSIITAVKPKTQLLLTGTPSKFIKQGLKPIIISGVEVYQEGYLADPYLACVYSAYSLDEASFDKVSNDVKASIKDTKAIVKKSFENLIEQMLERLKNANMIKGKPNLKGALTITGLHKAANYLFEKLDKTMISARSIEQAEMLHDILTKNKVDTLLSTSEDDTDSVNIEQFKNDPKIKVLVVVKRGILGFNMPELINVVDFSGTRNIDRIYQLYARTLRKYEDKPKFYFKLCYGVNQDIDSLYVQAALCLNNPSFIEKFNGKNLKAMDIIVLSKDKKKRDKDKDDKDNNVDNPKSISVDSNLAVEVLRLGLMSELTINDQHESWKEYKHVRFGKAIVKLQGLEFGLNPELKTDAELREEVFTLLAKEGIEHEKMY